MERLGEIEVPTLVMAGRDDFLFPPEHQLKLAAGIRNARLRIIERAEYNPHSERPDEVFEAIGNFIPANAVALAVPSVEPAAAVQWKLHASSLDSDTNSVVRMTLLGVFA